MMSPVVVYAFQSEEVDNTPNPRFMFDGEYEVTADGDVYHLALETSTTRLTVDSPEGWTYHLTEFGVMFSEGQERDFQNRNNVFDSFTVHLFVPPVDYFAEYTLPDAATTNLAFSVLDYVRNRPSLVGDALVSEPVAFEWEGHEAAYYLLNSQDGSLTLLFAVEAPDSNQLLVSNITAPASEMEHIRDVLPHILDTLTINGLQFDASLLNVFPDPLVFPGYDVQQRSPLEDNDGDAIAARAPENPSENP